MSEEKKEEIEETWHVSVRVSAKKSSYAACELIKNEIVAFCENAGISFNEIHIFKTPTAMRRKHAKGHFQG